MVHQKIPPNTYFKWLVEELNKYNELRTLALVVHLFVEYYINEIIIKLFPKGEIIIENRALNSFSKKINILKAWDLFKSDSDLLKNINLVNEIRNKYAHNLIASEVDKEAAKKINDIKILEIRYANVGFASQFDTVNQFKAKAVSTIISLNEVFAKLPK